MRVLLALCAAVAYVQEPNGAARAGLTGALGALQDSLDAVRGAGARFRVDLAAASPVLLYQRAERMRASCGAAARAAAVVDSATASPPAARLREHAALRRELAALRRALAECRRDYDTSPGGWPARADSVRAWAPFRLRRLDETTRRYAEAADLFKKAAGMR